MAHHSGEDVYIQFIGPAGTVTLHGDYRTISYDGEVDIEESTAGADVDKNYVVTTRQATGSITLVEDLPAGTAIYRGMYEGALGTLTWSTPRGTAAGEPKYSCPVIINSKSQPYEYNSVAIREFSWTKNGAWIDNYDLSGDIWP